MRILQILKKNVGLLFGFALLFALAGCQNAQPTELSRPLLKMPKIAETIISKPMLAWQWPHDEPENHGLSRAALERLHSDLDEVNVLAAVIVKDDYIVDEYYKPGYDENSLFILNSASKSVTSALVGIAIEQGCWFPA